MSTLATEELIQSLQQTATVEWINSVLLPTVADEDHIDVSSSLSELDQKITALVATLDIACEDTSTQLERIIDDTSRAVPRLTYDMHFMRDSAVSLQSSLTKVRQLSKQAVPPEISITLDHLQILDTMKRNMEAARDVLREAESWNSLEFEVTSLLAERSYAKAAERLSEASKSMAVFQNTPEFETRRTLMVNLQNQLEASLSSALVSAISSQDLVACKEYYAIFSNIQRESEFRNYYNGSRRASLVVSWHDTSLVDCDGSTSSTQTFSSFLPHFYGDFLSVLNVERVSMPSIFPAPAMALSQFVSSLLSNLQPTFPQRLSSLFTYYGPSALQELVLPFKATEEFVSSTERIMEKLKFSYSLPSPFDPPPSATDGSFPPATPSHSRRRSVRMSMSWRSGPHRSTSSGLNVPKSSLLQDTDALDWDQELLQPFLDFQVDYANLEKHFLEEELEHIVSSKANEETANLDQARLFRERVIDVASVADRCLTRCTSFTYGYGAVGMVHALDNLFRAFVETWTTSINTKSTTSKATSPESRATEDLSDLDYSAQDWSNFQLSVHLLASARVVFERISLFESKLRSTLIQIATQFRMARQDPAFILTSSRREDQLLEQSILNSAELQQLLSSVDSETNMSREGAASYPTPATPSLRASHVVPSMLSASPPLLVDARSAVFSFAQTCQTSLQTTLLSPLRKHLSSYATSPAWTLPGDPKSKRAVGGGGATDIQVPTFSLSPTETVQRVAEGLLNLPRLFEVYAEDDALSFSLHTLPFLGAETVSTLASLDTLSNAGGSDNTISPPPLQGGHRRRSSLAILPSAKLTPAPSINPEAVSSAWLSSLARSILTHLTTDILPTIQTLSVYGSAQLSSDLTYLSNIVSAIAMDFEELEKWTEAISLNDEEGKRRASEKREEDTVFWKVAKMRGWR